MLGGEVIRGAFNTGEHTARVELIGEALFSNLADVSDGARSNWRAKVLC
jgi:cyclomaltodextrinase